VFGAAEEILEKR